MSIPAPIAVAAASYHMNSNLLDKSFAGLTQEEWEKRPDAAVNSMQWIAGHVVWARASTLSLLGASWSRPWLPLFARGAKVMDASEYPAKDEILSAWEEVKASLSAAMAEAAPEALSAPAPKTIPSFDGHVSGVLGFLALHESYHVGQAGYLRRWLGHGQVIG